MIAHRLLSLTALAASLVIVILTITQASGLTGTPEPLLASLDCAGQIAATGCDFAVSGFETGLN